MASPATSAPAEAAPSVPVTRRASQRQQALRRPPSRTLRKREPNPGQQQQQQQQQYSTMHDSSDDEIPVPMKLSALTKALLDDGAPGGAQGAQEAPNQNPAPSPPRTRRRSALSSSTSAQQEERRHLRSGSSQAYETRQSRANSSALSPQKSRESSPIRKRVVRLSTTPKSLSQMKRRSTSQSRPTLQRKSSTSSRAPSRDRSSSSEVNNNNSSSSSNNHKPPPATEINTPAQQHRVVRIASGSSAARRRSGASSAVSSARSAHVSASESQGEPDVLEEPGTAARHRSGNLEDNPALQSSMRVKRVGKVPGSFLSGPARRGRRRQSEEDGEENGEGEHIPSSLERGSQPPEMNHGAADGPGSSFVAGDRYADFASGSPVSSKDIHRRHAAMADVRMSSARHTPPSSHKRARQAPGPEEHYREPEILPAADQENELPPILQQSKPYAFSVNPAPEKKSPRKPLPNIGSVGRATVSPARKPLAAITNNTPHRPAPPPPKMSVLDIATASAGASTTQQKQRRNIIRVNGKSYTRLDVIGRGGSAKVYRVTAENGKMWALKRVSLEHADEATVQGFKSEIDLLVKLAKVERVIGLLDFEMNDEKKLLTLVRTRLIHFG